VSRFFFSCQGDWLVKGRRLDDPNHGDGDRAFPQQASVIFQHAWIIWRNTSHTQQWPISRRAANKLAALRRLPIRTACRSDRVQAHYASEEWSRF
jgi:hypothetical protein